MSQAAAYAPWDYDKDLRETFRARDVEEEFQGGPAPLVLKEGERIAVRYFADPVPNYDLRNPEMVYGHARTIFDVADKDAGKSAHLEVFGEGHLERGNHLIDFHGSVDNESMAWLRSPWVDGRSVLIVHGPTCKLEFKGPKSWETKDVNKLTFADYSSYDIMLSSPKFFMDNDGTKDFTSIGRFLRRLLIHRENSKPIIYVIIREASEVIYSRIKADERQDEVKAQILSGLGQARHIGVSLGLDTQRAVNVDKAFRDLADYTFYKRPRGENMPDEKKFAYRYVDLEPMLTMANNQFVVVDTKGVGEGVNYLPPWHKREDDVMLAQLGIVQEFVEAPQAGEERGDVRTMGDAEHCQIIRLYMEGDGLHGPYSMNEIADLMDVSSATPYYHIEKVHNAKVREKGECPRCLRGSGAWVRAEVGR